MSAGKTSDGKQQKGQQPCDVKQQKDQRPPQAARHCKKAMDGKQLTEAPSLQKVLSADIGQYTGGLVMEDGDLVVMVWESETWQCPRVCGAVVGRQTRAQHA